MICILVSVSGFMRLTITERASTRFLFEIFNFFKKNWFPQHALH